jgi:signal transduction histidine kinase/DNA-binding response OmpR family regulator
MPSSSDSERKSVAQEFVSSSALLYPAIILLSLAVLLADVYTPLGVAIWIFYFAPISLTLFLWRAEAPFIAAGIVTVLMTITLFTDSLGMNPQIAQLNRIFGVAMIWATATLGYFFIRNRIAVRRQQRTLSIRAGLNQVMTGEQSPGQFGSSVLSYLAQELSAHVGAFFVRDGDVFRRTATYGVPAAAEIVEQFATSDGLLGQAVIDGRTILVQPVPDGYLKLGSSLGHASPRSLTVAPTSVEGQVNAVVELGFLGVVDSRDLEIFEAISESVGVAVRSSRYRSDLQRLLGETQRQAEVLQVQSEELRVANEELEEQSRSLQDSQSRLENQQVELEQVNSQLEEHAQTLESQRDDLAKARAELEIKAKEVERESRYKSEFLANMSHELRTPLNSLLILSKLLADNSSANLTEEQIQSANTIHSAGNDLLTLINDILDLSKIEAGRMEIRPETVSVGRLAQDLASSLRPLAEQKGLTLEASIDADCPESIRTDRLRLEQVLKNLISNAVKFTDRGGVTLLAKLESHGKISLAVKDTGIGIDPDKQTAIFDAFRQLDSAANRKYSGTGLGLSISRQLVHLLGGTISLQSRPGHGSTFTVTLPLVYEPIASEPGWTGVESAIVDSDDRPPAKRWDAIEAPSDRETASIGLERGQTKFLSSQHFSDDRERLKAGSRTILVVEDDESFARLLYGLAREQEFQCLVATSAEEAMAVAIQHLPSAIVLDVGLPDQSGLTVLDRLKHDSRTRHIPVHIVSGNDYVEAAMSLGAVGYMLKPVTREALVEALAGLETRLVRTMRRVLVVEDDAVQLDSLRKLLGSGEVETVGVRTAGECLELLKSSTFDCMVLDLSLPDASGYSLLETLSREDAYSFPPVIVYTGRDLTSDEEHELRKYSKSIIIKGAKSPERLLDEVTLFLHQVVSELPVEQQKMIQQARSREAALEGRRILVVEDDVRNVFALTSILEPRGATVLIARNGREALAALDGAGDDPAKSIDLILMDVMMPEMDGLTATREIRKRPEWKTVPIIVLTAKAMKDDQEKCFEAGANDYMSKPLDVDKLLSLVRVWIRR